VGSGAMKNQVTQLKKGQHTKAFCRRGVEVAFPCVDCAVQVGRRLCGRDGFPCEVLHFRVR